VHGGAPRVVVAIEALGLDGGGSGAVVVVAAAAAAAVAAAVSGAVEAEGAGRAAADGAGVAFLEAPDEVGERVEVACVCRVLVRGGGGVL